MWCERDGRCEGLALEGADGRAVRLSGAARGRRRLGRALLLEARTPTLRFERRDLQAARPDGPEPEASALPNGRLDGAGRFETRFAYGKAVGAGFEDAHGTGARAEGGDGGLTALCGAFSRSVCLRRARPVDPGLPRAGLAGAEAGAADRSGARLDPVPAAVAPRPLAVRVDE